MDYLEYFGFNSEPFSHAPISRYYYSSKQHTDALRRLLHIAQTMKGLAILIGDIGHGKTTLARRMLDAMPENEFEAALLVIVHAGVTANWLLRRIATQLGVKDVAEDKLTILSQLYQRLVEIHNAGKKAVVLIDEAQMLGTRELMEEFRGMLNLEVPDHKLISFVFFGLPEIEPNLRLDPPLAQRVALRYHLKPLAAEDTAAYVQHRLRLAGGQGTIFTPEALAEVHQQTRGVPRVINSLCDNVLLELFFNKSYEATPELVVQVAQSLGLHERDLPPPTPPPQPVDEPAVPGGRGEDAVVAVRRGDEAPAVAPIAAASTPAPPTPAVPTPAATPAAAAPARPKPPPPSLVTPKPIVPAPVAATGGEASIDAMAARIAGEAPPPDELPPKPRPKPMPLPSAPAPIVPAPRGLDIEDPLSFLPQEAPPPQSFGLAAGLENLAEHRPAQDDDHHEVDLGDIEIEAPPPPTPAPRPASPAPAARPAPAAAQPRPVASAPPAAPAASKPAPPKPAAPKPVKTSSGSTINLDEIDSLLADLNLGKK